jgi:hypothetical protein
MDVLQKVRVGSTIIIMVPKKMDPTLLSEIKDKVKKLELIFISSNDNM